MKFNMPRAGGAVALLAMLLQAVSPETFFFLPLAGGQLQQFAVCVGAAYVLGEFHASFKGKP